MSEPEMSTELGDEAPEDSPKEDDAEGSHTLFPTESSLQGQKSSLGPSQSKIYSEEQLNADDVKKAITFSPSITEAINDTVPPMREITIHHVPKEDQQGILLKACQRVKDDFTEARALAEIHKMFDLYKSSLVDTSLLESQCHELQEKLRQYEARHQWDPRVLKVLLIAEKYRQEKALVYDERNELEAEVIDMTIEMKHMEDVLKNKNKDLLKVQDEIRKAKELEKQVETMENLLMKKDNEYQALQDSYDAQVNFKTETQHYTPQRMSAPVPDELRAMFTERDVQVRVEHVQAEKAALKSEVEEKNRLLQISHRKLNNLRMENNDLESLRRDNMKAISKLQSENNRMQNNYASLQSKLGILRDQLTTAKSEILSLNKTLESCEHNSTAVSHLLSVKTKESVAFQHQMRIATEKVVHLKQEHKLCEQACQILKQETKIKDLDNVMGRKKLMDKTSECDSLSNKLDRLEQMKAKHLELLRLTRLNTAQMMKEISLLRAHLFCERNSMARAEGTMACLQAQIEALQREYVDVLEKNLLLVRNHEMASATIEHFEQAKVVTDRRIARLMKTNIDLYTQTRNQQEIALIQNHQFHLKENEIKGLLSRLEEEDSKMEVMLCKDKEKRCALEQLHAEASHREEKIKTLKSIIESASQLNKSLSDKAEELVAQLRQAQTQKELIRRQRDLFGIKLLQSRAETELCQEKLRSASTTMTKYSVDFYSMQNDIRCLKLEINNLRRKKKMSEGHVELILTLRQELGQACKALELQKSKNVILEETRMPMAHRWRDLLAADPSKYEMVLKNQHLIKRLINKTKEVAGLEQLLKQKDTMYLSMCVLVQRRMDIQLTPQMSEAKSLIRKQHRQLKSLTAELNMATDDACIANAREKYNKKKLDEKVLEEARQKIAKLRASKKRKTQVPAISTVPLLPDVHKARQ